MKPCIICNGTGWERIKRPCKMYKGQAVDTVRRCKACVNGFVKEVADGKSAAAGRQ